MENRVITIARSYGSGGRKMGRLLAKDLAMSIMIVRSCGSLRTRAASAKSYSIRWMRDSISRCSALRARLIPER